MPAIQLRPEHCFWAVFWVRLGRNCETPYYYAVRFQATMYTIPVAVMQSRKRWSCYITLLSYRLLPFFLFFFYSLSNRGKKCGY